LQYLKKKPPVFYFFFKFPLQIYLTNTYSSQEGSMGKLTLLLLAAVALAALAVTASAHGKLRHPFTVHGKMR
ncbi:hypothetical protein V2J09_016267, partial [Rumex salicifolius]